MSPSSHPHEIIVLGANFGGLGVSHYLLKHTIPALKALSPSKDYHLSLVSPSTHFFWKIAAPRAILPDNNAPQEKIFLPIEPAFKQYPTEQFTFHQGTATYVDKVAREVTIRGPDDTSTVLRYDSLVIATGVNSNLAWSLNGNHEQSTGALDALRTALPKAKTILIGGGGAVGVETSGEIGAKFYGQGKDITLISGAKKDERVLQTLTASTSKEAEKRLAGLGVKVVHGLRVTGAVPSAKGNKTIVKLDDGSERTVDIYLDATGGKPNSDFLPREWLDERSRVLTDAEGLRVHAVDSKGGMGAIVPDVYAIGDVASYGDRTAIDINNSVVPISRALGADLVAKIAGGDKKAAGNKVFEPKKWTPMKNTMGVPIGPSGGVGRFDGWKVPSFVIWALKARDYMVPKAVLTVNGSAYVKA